MKTFILIPILLIVIQGSSLFDECNDVEDAARCDNIYKCCDRFNDCGDNNDDCDPDNGGKPMRNHCYYIQKDCSDCCIMSQEKHYCGTKQECGDLQTARSIFIAIVVVYCVSLAGFCIFGCYKRHHTLKLIHKIAKESAEFDEERRRNNALGQIIQAGTNAIGALLK